jgi:hypothetical protein
MYKKQGKPAPKEMASTVFYNRGVLIGALHVEAIRNALKAKPDGKITGDDVKKRLREDQQLHARRAGAAAQDHAADHEGGGLVQIWQVKGGKFEKVTDWFAAYPGRGGQAHQGGGRQEVAPRRTGAASTGRAAPLRRRATDHAEPEQRRGHLRRRDPRPQGRVARRAAKADHDAPRRQRRGQDDDAQGRLGRAPHPSAASHQGPSSWPASASTDLRRYDVVRRGVVQVFEGRRVFEHLTTEENLVAGGHVQSDRARLRDGIQRVYQYFPRLADRRPRAVRLSVRRRAADARHRPRADVHPARHPAR